MMSDDRRRIISRAIVSWYEPESRRTVFECTGCKRQDILLDGTVEQADPNSIRFVHDCDNERIVLPPEGWVPGICVQHGSECSGIHYRNDPIDWCRRGKPHSRSKCDDDCRAWRGSGVFLSDTEAAEEKGMTLISRDKAARNCGPHGDQEGRYHDEKG